MRKLRLPVVLVNAAAHLGFPPVWTDDGVAMEQAYGHLASLGHERRCGCRRSSGRRTSAYFWLLLIATIVSIACFVVFQRLFHRGSGLGGARKG